MNLSGKSVLVTGGAIRVGAEICRVLADAGATVLIHCRGSVAEAEALAASLPGTGHRVFQADFSAPGAAAGLAGQVGVFDALVNNASFYDPVPAGIESEERARKHWEINFFAPLALMRAFAELELPEGAAVNVVDQEVLSSVPGRGSYSLSRRALTDATLEFAKVYGPANLRFNAVAPGPMIPPPQFAASGMKKTLPTLPLGRRVEPVDLAKTVLFLLENDSITGAVVPVDCGQHLGRPE